MQKFADNNFRNRIVTSLKRQIIGLSASGVIIVLGIYFIVEYYGGLFFSVGVLFLLYILIEAYVQALYLIDRVEVQDDIKLHYFKKDERKILLIVPGETLYRIRDVERFGRKRLVFLVQGHVVLRQYEHLGWSEEQLEALIKHLDELGFRRPYGENL